MNTSPLTGLTPAQETFRTVYIEKLREAIATNPKEYAFPASEAEFVVARMVAAVERGDYNKDGQAFKATCKALKIPYTYAGVNAYWKGGVK